MEEAARPEQMTQYRAGGSRLVPRWLVNLAGVAGAALCGVMLAFVADFGLRFWRKLELNPDMFFDQYFRIWLVASIFAVFVWGLGCLVLLWQAIARRRGGPEPGFCRNCGYNLFGLRDPRCPECGTVFEPDTNGTDAPTADAKGENGNAKAGHTRT